MTSSENLFNLILDTVIQDTRWPEPVRVIRLDPIGDSVFTLHVVGLNTNHFYQPVLTREDVENLIRQVQHAQTLDGNASQFGLATEAYRIRLAHLYDPLFAVSVSKIDPLPHQLEAVYEHMLPQPALRFMLADDPGAGKTVMAGLLFKELKLRGVLTRTLIVVPSPLRMQWQREMREKFAEHFDIIERATLDALGPTRAWGVTNQCITSVDFAKQPDVLDSLAVAGYWDLIIVDEAHKMSAYRRSPTKIERSQRYRLGEVLAERAERLVLMTATPHKGDPENFRLLLSLIDSDLFADEHILRRAVERNENPIFLRRLKEDMKGFDGRPLFPPRHAHTVGYRLEGLEKVLYDRVTEYVETHFNRALADENRNVTFALIILQRRLASSVHAIKRSLENRQQRLIDLHDEVIRDPDLLEKARNERLAVNDYDDEDLSEEERWELEEKALRYTVARNLDELEIEIQQLGQLIELAEDVAKHGTERKLLELEGVMHQLQLGESGEQLLIFTEAKDTLDYLVENLIDWGFSLITIHGGLKPEKRVEAEQIFRSGKAQVLVATEAAGEGINLQFCHLMVNYDIPWNPTRIEQRLGRIHRYGQEYEVHMYNLVAQNTREGRVLDAVLHKLERMRRGMGSDRVYDVVGERLSEVHLESLIQDAVLNRRRFDEILATINVALPEQNVEVINQAALTSLATHFVDVRAMIERRRIAEERRMAPAFIREFFLKATESLWPGRADQRSNGNWRMRHVPAELREIPSELAEQYGQPSDQYLEFTFDLEESKRTGVEFVGPGHSLFEAVIHHTLTRYQEALQRGAIFHDLDGEREGLIWLLEGKVEDGQGLTVGQQLFALYQPANGGEIETLHPSIFLDLEKPSTPDPLPEQLADMLDDKNNVIGWGIMNVLNPYRQEVEARRQHDVEIVEKYLRESFDVLIARSDGMLMDYEARQRQGRDMRVKIAEEERRNEYLRRRKTERLIQAEREQNIMLSEPRVLGVAAVLPIEEQITGETPMRRDDAVEQAAIDVVLDYEKERGWQAEDLSPEKLPYDVLSRGPNDDIRYIEVKGRAGMGGVELSEREWLMAENLGEKYWLYIVTEAVSEPRLHIVQDPVHNLPSDLIVRRTRYHVTSEAWQNAAE